MRAGGRSTPILICGLLGHSACSGPLSTLDPAGRSAARIAELFFWMAGGAIVIWVAVIAIAAYAVASAPERHGARAGTLLVIGGGVVVPVVVLAVLLAYGLAMLPPLLAPAPEGSLRIAVTGEQFWWRVRYLPPHGEPIELANELRLPVGEPVEIELTSPDVIHSFWVPALGGKMDLIPGRATRLRLEPTRTGTFRGVCAEYCGASHAYMAFWVVVLEKEEFSSWLAEQARPARAPADPVGEELFLGNGCGACHTIRGTAADGVIGPDLTHIGSRLSIAAGRFGSDGDHLARWIASTTDVKPGALMPAFSMLPEEHLRLLALYLEGLR